MTEQSCTCPFTDPATWTTHYGAIEPGSTQEYDPTCPAHAPTAAATSMDIETACSE